MTELLKKNYQISAWLDQMGVCDYKLIEDSLYGFVVDVEGDVNIKYKKLTELSVKFNTVSGNFNCSYNQLTTLTGSPQSVGGSFSCSQNQLTSLRHGPQCVVGYFECNHNRLSSLEFCPPISNGDFDCTYNELLNLLHCPCPKNAGNLVSSAYFFCDHNPALGDIQKIGKFSEIYDIHKHHVSALKEKTMLTSSIEPSLIFQDASAKRHKI